MLYLACLPWASHLPVSSTFPRGGLDNLVKAFTNLLTLFDSRIILPGSALEEPRILTLILSSRILAPGKYSRSFWVVWMSFESQSIVNYLDLILCSMRCLSGS